MMNAARSFTVMAAGVFLLLVSCCLLCLAFFGMETFPPKVP
jgi:hypothetical protein